MDVYTKITKNSSKYELSYITTEYQLILTQNIKSSIIFATAIVFVFVFCILGEDSLWLKTFTKKWIQCHWHKKYFDSYLCKWNENTVFSLKWLERKVQRPAPSFFKLAKKYQYCVENNQLSKELNMKLRNKIKHNFTKNNIFSWFLELCGGLLNNVLNTRVFDILDI